MAVLYSSVICTQLCWVLWLLPNPSDVGVAYHLLVNIFFVSQVINLVSRALSGHEGPQSVFPEQREISEVLPV